MLKPNILKVRMRRLNRTLTHAAALQPCPGRVPDKLLPVLLDGDVEGVSDVWVVQVPHTQHLRGQQRHVWESESSSGPLIGIQRTAG